MKHCCKYMESNINDSSSHTKYNKIKRCYYIERKNKNTVNAIFFCPWCASELPKDLILEYDTIASKAYGEDIDLVSKNKIPQEFKSDEWWKKRGL